MNNRHTVLPKVSISQEPQGDGRGLKGKKEQDYLSIILWSLLVMFTLQGFYAGVPVAIAWVGLGAAILMVKRGLPIRLLLLMEAPVFFGIICFSVSTIHLALEERTYDIVYSSEIADAMWLAWWAMVLFSVGMVLALRWYKLKPHDENEFILLTSKQAILIALFGFLCNEVLIKYVPSSVWNAIYVFGYCSPIGLFLIFKIWTRSNPEWIRSWKFAAWISALLLWALHSVTGGIFGSTLLILLLFSSEYTQRSKLVLGGFIVFVVLMAPLLQDAKSDYRRRIAEDASRKERKLYDVFYENFHRVFIEGEGGAYRQGIASLANRLCTFDIWLSVKRHIDARQDYAEGQTIKDSLLNGFVPRIAWPIIFGGEEKPKMGGSSELAKKYGDMLIAESTSVGVGAISELYINGGKIVLFVGMILLGALSGLILALGINDRVQPLSLGMCIVVFSTFVRPEVNLSDMLGAIVRSIFLWWILRTWILFQFKKVQAVTMHRKRSASF